MLKVNSVPQNTGRKLLANGKNEGSSSVVTTSVFPQGRCSLSLALQGSAVGLVPFCIPTGNVSRRTCLFPS